MKVLSSWKKNTKTNGSSLKKGGASFERFLGSSSGFNDVITLNGGEGMAEGFPSKELTSAKVLQKYPNYMGVSKNRGKMDGL